MLTTYELTFAFIGAFCGAALMMFVVIWTDLLRKEQIKSTKLWFRLWMSEKDRAEKAEAKLAVIHEQHVAAGKERHRKDRARIMAKCAEMRAELQKSTVVPIKDAT